MGSVKDTNGEPLIGVTVFVKERPSVGTATDINGNYLIDVQTDDVLEFSYVGYKTQDVAVAGRGLLDIVLEQNDAILDAVEVVGYGVQKKISVIGSQQSIQVKELKVPVANLTQGLAGRVAGLVRCTETRPATRPTSRRGSPAASPVWSPCSEPANRASTTRTSTSAASRP